MRKRRRTTAGGHTPRSERHVPRAVSWAAMAIVVGAITAAPLLGVGGPESGVPEPREPYDPIVVTGFSGPESVRFDAQQGVWFVGNWNGPASATDNNGMISVVRADGTLDTLDFISGGRDGATLHAPRGMTIVGDTLWVTDVDAIRGFHRRTGEFLAAVDMTRWEPGFLNDIAADDSGTLYVTDTGRNRIYRVRDMQSSIALEDSTLGRPNGITWHAREGVFVVVPFGGSRTLMSWRAGGELEPWRTLPSGGRYDGVEVLRDGRVVVASQADSSVYVLPAESSGSTGEALVRIGLEGAPADLGVDDAAGRVAVPYVARDLIELWPLGGI